MSMCVQRTLPQLTYAQAVSRMTPASCPVQRALSLPNHWSQNKLHDEHSTPSDSEVINQAAKLGHKRDLSQSSSQTCPKTEKISRLDSFSGEQVMGGSLSEQPNTQSSDDEVPGDDRLGEPDLAESLCGTNDKYDISYTKSHSEPKSCSLCGSTDCSCEEAYCQIKTTQTDSSDKVEEEEIDGDDVEGSDMDEDTEEEDEKPELKEESGEELSQESDDDAETTDEEEDDDDKEEGDEEGWITDGDSNKEDETHFGDESDKEEINTGPSLPPRIARQHAMCSASASKGPETYAELYCTESNYSTTQFMGPSNYECNFYDEENEEEAFFASIGFGHDTGHGYAFPRRAPTTIKKLAGFWETDFQVGGAIYPKMADWDKKGVTPVATDSPKDYKRYLTYRCLYNKWIDTQKDMEQWWNLYRGHSLAQIACMKKPHNKMYPAHHPKAIVQEDCVSLELPAKKCKNRKRTPWIWRDEEEEYDPMSVFFSNA